MFAGTTRAQALHVAFVAGIVASLLGAVLSSMRGEHRSWEESVPATEAGAG